MTPRERERFDAILEEEMEHLPPHLKALLEEAPLIVEDRPSLAILKELDIDPDEADTLCGLHTGRPLTERSVEAPDMEYMHLFREGIVAIAGGWRKTRAPDGGIIGGEDAVRDEIHITLLHEIGHHFGLEDDDLEGLGYG